MTKSSNRKWLFLPPAVALLIVLGPLSMRSEPANAATQAAPSTAAQSPTAQSPMAQSPAAQAPTAQLPGGMRTDSPTNPALPRTPDLWQVGSTLLGVLLLGGGGLLVLRRLRQGPAPSGNGLVALRQSLRLSPKQTVHAVEFDGRLLLLGDGERGLTLLQASSPTADATLAADAAAAVEPEDDGAVPRDLVLPRPPAASARPRADAAAQRTGDAARRNPLSDFRALLAKAGR